MKSFHYDRQLQAHMHAFIYVDTETMTKEDYFTAIKQLVEN